MASSSAQLLVTGRTYPVRHCTYEFTQAADPRGRAAAKVRMGLVHLVLDVPTDDTLLTWAATPFKPLAGQVVFLAAQGGSALETLSWEAGQCVGYQEEFASGDTTTGAYVCHLTIAAPNLTVQAGGPAVAYASPEVALIGVPPLVGPPVVPPAVPFVLPTVEEVAAVVGEKALEGLAAAGTAVATPVALALGLILASSTPAGGPGIPQTHMVPIDPDLSRLNKLLADHAAGSLAARDESELMDLLAKLKGIRVRSLADLTVVGKYKDQPTALPGFHFEEISYCKRSEADTAALRNRFEGVRAKFMRKISDDPGYVQQLRRAGFDDDDLALMQRGKVPSGWQVHHKLPLDDGGDNSFDNLLLIKLTPYHSVVTGYQKTYTGKLKPGECMQLPWPSYGHGIVYPATKP